MDRIKELLPEKIKKAYEQADRSNLTEIRLRTGSPVYFYVNGIEYGADERGISKCDGYVFTKKDAEVFWQKLCGGAPYSVTENQRAGYITLDGNRVGFAGEYACADGEVKHLLSINSFCIRIMHQVKGCGRQIYKSLFEDNYPCDTLIVSPPGCGKTTLLRDLARLFSSDGYSVCIADERGEIAGGNADVGKRTDVFSGADKARMINNMVRSLAPQIIIADELGSEDDIKAVNTARTQGVTVIASAHGRSAADAEKRVGKFKRYVLLDKSFVSGGFFKVE